MFTTTDEDYLRRWLTHFQTNRSNRPEPDWSAPITVHPGRLRPLLKSIEQFDLGDGGGPACLIAFNAETFRSATDAQRELVDLWFREEAEHSRLLGALVDRFGGHHIEGHWSFSAFCLSRRVFGVRFELTVLLVTEIVSTAYYRLLERHTDDLAVRGVARLILRDEAGHVAFHRGRMARTRPARLRLLGDIYLTMAALAAATMLWVNHAPGVCAVGASTREFYAEVWRELTRFSGRLRREQDALLSGTARSGVSSKA